MIIHNARKALRAEKELPCIYPDNRIYEMTVRYNHPAPPLITRLFANMGVGLNVNYFICRVDLVRLKVTKIILRKN